ncbi:class D beta-lactamase [Cellvibrio sp. OA-2007]|uniref:class D beta-lactamase n=1 Tax=Cellvibrio sp. OA-2007 TaxID=529823 RepID=UPI000ABA568B|nr:class D beta-lactamase [Cellvibrio sp. OA-2007]
MKIKMAVALLLLTPLMSFADVCKTTKLINTEPYIADIGTRKITFLAVDYKKNHCWAINESGLAQRHGPYSSFKIPHTLIALEAGAVKSVDERFEWNQQKHPAKSFWPETWKQSHTLATAFKHSAVWYYQELVPRIEPEQYKKWLATFRYGNQTFTPGSDQFWLNRELQISPVEQVSFIACLLKNRCGVSAKNFSSFESAALQETKNGLSLYAKTGAGSIDPDNNDGAFEGWYVGYIKDKNAKPVAAFALHMEAENFSDLKDSRKALALQLLADLGLWSDEQK